MLAQPVADDPNTPPIADPPARIGRISLLSGTVSFKPNGAADWDEATINQPLSRGDMVWTDRDGRAELHLGGVAVRVAEETSLNVLNLDDAAVQLSVTQGLVELRLHELEPHQLVELDMPNASVSVLKPGVYRFDIPQNSETTTVVVRHGRAEIMTSGGAVDVPDGQMARLTGQTNPTNELMQAGIADTFDDWCHTRDTRESNVETLRYVPRDMVGYEDLDESGTWDTGEYGPIWYPSVAVGWTPYSYGRWSYMAPWGWTWIDAAAWGFAPFHYGRWTQWNNRWGWLPGPRQRPVYAPALVAFMGAGLGAGTVGWFPLGPHEIYVPGYRCSYHYVRNLNAPHAVISSVGHIQNAYINRAVTGAITAVPRDVFSEAHAVGVARMPISAAQLRTAEVASSHPNLPPQTEHTAPRAVAMPPQAAQARAFWNRAAPAPHEPEIFRVPQTYRHYTPSRYEPSQREWIAPAAAPINHPRGFNPAFRAGPTMAPRQAPAPMPMPMPMQRAMPAPHYGGGGRHR